MSHVVEKPDVEYGESNFENAFGDNTRTRLLRYLVEQNGTARSQLEVAEEIGVSQAMVSRVLGELESNNLTEREHGSVILADTDVADQLVTLVRIMLDTESHDQ